MTLPTVFLPHGAGPCFFMEWGRGPADTWDRTAAYLQGLIPSLPERPKAILVVSGHWEAEVFTAGTAERPALDYDYYGFPPHTYQLTFDAPGSPTLAHRVRRLLGEAGIASAEDAGHGWDHGVFVPLKLVTPDADIPVVQLSLKADLDPKAHLAAGRALSPLRDEGVLIVGSGMSWHNMRGFSPAFTERSAAFDRWLEAAVTDPTGREAALARWDSAPHGREAHPREEHLLPLMVAAGAAPGEPAVVAFRDTVMDVVVSAVEFGRAA
ncbi:MAG: dioxygenase [Phenylobacterium sp. RIFCSPHIGHO2_01_FULL_69_31]|uniref:DODA-type extradiol aromatic ring-opening family dioxygenase n=1 Tax=Phenylobacterium sp. RIFCSPHIGHO2_01_FULL_69_31 TaxID=1801944 RepID=UPI0008B62F69|nr:class III extradiol ring-cleavage dioxygenase [Phenylobacterium sp. RIFCSPHIGHO2_01_FULL_69_31]OHB31390.1 MAG: dioxygenase [Phenylobacterium sp. RIFCSPHIGHO2_01_FULL_69_31]